MHNGIDGALRRANEYVQDRSNKARFDSIPGSREWFGIQVALVAGQLLEGMSRINRAYDFTQIASIFDLTVQSVGGVGAKAVLDDLVYYSEIAMSMHEEARPEGYDQYSEAFLRDIFKVIYNLNE